MWNIHISQLNSSRVFESKHDKRPRYLIGYFHHVRIYTKTEGKLNFNSKKIEQSQYFTYSGLFFTVSKYVGFGISFHMN